MHFTFQEVQALADKLGPAQVAAVTVLKHNPPVEATVKSSQQDTPLQVVIDNAEGGIEATCTCQTEGLCPHIAAVYKHLQEVVKPNDAPTEDESTKTEPNKLPAIQQATLPILLTPQELIGRHKELADLVKTALVEGTDYGTIPGIKRETLLKPGAERIAIAFGCYPTYSIEEQEIDHDRKIEYETKEWVNTDKKPSKEAAAQLKEKGLGRWRKAGNTWVWQESKGTVTKTAVGLYRYVIKCSLIQRNTGRTVGSGLGSCSTMETKYISRPRDLENTIIKMAEKRAFVGSVLNAFGLSDRFTQDVEDL